MRSVLFYALFFMLVPISHLSAKTSVIPLDKIIAVVDDSIITNSELSDRVNQISQRITQSGKSLPSKIKLREQVLEQLILEKLQLEMAIKTGIRINDEMVNRVIDNIAKENRLSMDDFRKVLAKDGFEFSEFRENIRREVTISRLRKIRVSNKINVSEQEIENHLNQSGNSQSANTEYRLSHILIATPEAATPEQIEISKLKAQKVIEELAQGTDFSQTAIAVSNSELALKGGDLGWRKTAQLPTVFSSIVNEMRKNEIKGPLQSASGFHIIKLQDIRRSGQKYIVEQTLARHILIRPTQVLTREEARLRLKDILRRIRNGEDFSSLARASSDDKASAVEGGSLDWISPGKMVPAFEEEMAKLKAGEISEPFTTQFGWHIVQVLSRRKHDNTDQFQRSQAIQLIRKRKTEEGIQDWLRRLRAEAYIDYRTNK